MIQLWQDNMPLFCCCARVTCTLIYAPTLPENGSIDPERPSAPSQRLSFVSARKSVPSLPSFGGIYAIVAPSLWCAVGKIIIPWEESFRFSGQPVVKGPAAYKTQL
jgi:hypothetical protein